MSAPRVLIVEPDSALALSVAAVIRDAGWTSAVAASAAEAELEIAARRPTLVVMRAELPDLPGFSFCARLRREPALARLPVILYSSETSPDSLAEHARRPGAADGYLSMPLDIAALTAMAARVLATGQPVELADDDPDLREVPLPAPGPPPVPRRARRALLTEADRLFADRAFQSVADRRDVLVAEAERRRPPPRRDLLATPEGRLTLLREDLRWREAQLARLSELWEIREREVASVDERIHAKDVEVQRARLAAEELQRRLAEALHQLGEQDRAHGESIEGLLSEKFMEEKELIEVVAGTERRLHQIERELRSRDERLAQAAGEAAGLQERIAEGVGEARGLRQRLAELEGTIDGLQRTALATDERSAELAEQVEARDAVLRGAGREVDRLQGELSAARQALMLRESEARGEVERARFDVEEVAGLLAQATRERDQARARVSAVEGELAAARAEAAALGAELEAVRARVMALSAEPTVLERLAAGPAGASSP